MASNAQPIRDLSQGQDAYQRLISEIRSGALGPGDRLTETDLAERLGISRTPVREAIRALEADGLVVHVPRVGASIRRLTYSEVTELYEMRAVLEGTAARLAARTASDVELAELQMISDEMALTPAEAPRLYALNRQFHATLLDAARNRFLLEAVAGLEKTLLILGPTTMEDAGRVRQAQAEHEAILNALNARDGDRAETLMRAHINAAHAMRLRQFRSEEQGNQPL
ncbi:GntR family transcriptional regulator [Pseudorhodobacter aquimaris]|uniref:GntR family transcriptional regulator n=1 Tax=Pseudorhodobacter aquimaris TaxID=687412 RepID=UPI000A418BA5|nr:GntR family transcriptional regulator [Pseudorhodobacter aquimaris]